MKYFCVVSHTHWDREWYMPLERFKLKLVDLIDHLLATLEKYPAYIFHLDAQTVVLEDYLEYRPSRRESPPSATCWKGAASPRLLETAARWAMRRISSATSLSCRRS